MVPPRTPVIVGAGQLNSREHGAEPIDLMARSVEQALADTGAPALRDAIEAVRVVWGVWPYRDPGRLVADRIGAAGRARRSRRWAATRCTSWSSTPLIGSAAVSSM